MYTLGFPWRPWKGERAIADGGQELDMVVNISKVLSGDWNYVRDDIKAVVEIAVPGTDG